MSNKSTNCWEGTQKGWATDKEDLKQYKCPEVELSTFELTCIASATNVAGQLAESNMGDLVLSDS